MTGLKVNDHLILLTFEISRKSHRLRRRVTLPETLQVKGEPQYHFVQYKSSPATQALFVQVSWVVLPMVIVLRRRVHKQGLLSSLVSLILSIMTWILRSGHSFWRSSSSGCTQTGACNGGLVAICGRCDPCSGGIAAACNRSGPCSGGAGVI